jgi:NAD(P)-dependent dehydrogenase (short-subunit alcohol dehydrogenase family)
MGFDGRVAIVTGAGNGLGRSHALLLAGRGAQVVVNDVDADAASAVVDEIERAGGVAVANDDSVTTPEGGAGITAAAVAAFGRVDIVVNNAGFVRDRAFHKITPEDVDAVLDVHLRGAFWVTSPAWRLMREQGYGRVVFTTSAGGLLGNFGQSNYAAAKMGILGLMRVLSTEGETRGIRVNAIAPMAATRMTEGLLGDMTDALGPDLVSPVVGWLCHEDCEVTGEIFTTGGGRVGRYFVGVAPGFHDPKLTMESVRDHLDAIRDLTGHVVPVTPDGEVPLFMERFS